MCLIVAAWRVHPRFPLVLAANRDECHRRPAAPAARWQTPAGLVGGRDLEAGGTWLAADTLGRVAAVTNVREQCPPPEHARSRGELPVAFLGGRASDYGYALAIHPTSDSVFLAGRTLSDCLGSRFKWNLEAISV